MANNIEFKMCTLNVKGIRNAQKRRTILNWANMNNIQILCVQETFFTVDIIDQVKYDWKGLQYHSVSDSSHSRGVSIFIKNGMNITILKCEHDKFGRQLKLEFVLDGKRFFLFNIYAPNDSTHRATFLETLNTSIKNVQEIGCNNILVCGDFNSIYIKSDRLSNNLDRTSNMFKKLLLENQMNDIWKKLNSNIQEYTYISPGNARLKSRIDYILGTDDIMFNIVSSSINVAPTPDHSAVVVQYKERNIELGKGYWKLNNSILDDEDYKISIRNIFSQTVAEFQQSVPYRLIFDLFKSKVKEYTIRYCIRRKRSKWGKGIVSLENQLSRLQQHVDGDNSNEIHRLKKQIDDFYINEAQGRYIRSRAKWLEQGEKSSTYFLNLENKHQKSNLIAELTNSNGGKVSSTQELLDETYNFYTKLYSRNTNSTKNTHDYLDNINFPIVLDVSEKQSCEGYVSHAECTEVVKNLKKNKSPGKDGLTAEFYQVFWADIGDFMVKMFNQSYDDRELSVTQRNSILSLLYKKGDNTFLKNYRPLSLSNTDYKILAFVLANRIQKVIPKLVSEQQSAYMKNRYIGNNVRFIDDLLYYCKCNKIGGALLFLDFQKAFDSISWDFIFKTLEKFGFGNDFIQWLQLLYTKPFANIKMNGHFTDSIQLERGIRQGCPVSSLVFLLCVQVMALELQSNDTFSGITIKNSNFEQNVKVIQYADDTVLIVNDIEHSEIAINSLNSFSSASGLVLNKDKTEGIKLGTDILKNGTQIVRWKDNVRCLGVEIGHDQLKCEEKNWGEKVEKMAKIIKSWGQRDLTILGKIQIIKTLLLSQFVYSILNTDIPTTTLRQIEDMCYKFIWPKKEWVKRKHLICTKKEGGLNMVDIVAKFNAIQAKVFHRILLNSNSMWSCIPIFFFEQFSGVNQFWREITCTTFNSLPESFTKIPSFYTKAMLNFNCITHTNLSDNSIYRNELIWLNNNIKWQNKCILFKNWISANIMHVNDVIDNEGNILYERIWSALNNKAYFHIEINILKHIIRNLSIQHTVDYTRKQVDTNKFYDAIVQEKRDIPTFSFWQKAFNTHIDTNSVVRNRLKDVKDNKFYMFIYKILMATLIHGKRVSKWDYTVPYNCPFNECNDRPHTLSHLLFECYRTRKVLTKLKNIINLKDNFKLEDIIIGQTDEKTNLSIFICLFYVYKYWLKIVKNDLDVNCDILQFVKHELELYYYTLCYTKMSKERDIVYQCYLSF